MKLPRPLWLNQKTGSVILVLFGLTLVCGGLACPVVHRHKSPPLPQTTYRAGQIPLGSTKLTYLSGASAAQSAVFSAPLAWDVYWDFLCDESSSPGYFNVTVFTRDGIESTRLRPIVATGISGFGDQPYVMSQGEPVWLRVDSNCNWHVTAQSAAPNK